MCLKHKNQVGTSAALTKCRQTKKQVNKMVTLVAELGRVSTPHMQAVNRYRPSALAFLLRIYARDKERDISNTFESATKFAEEILALKKSIISKLIIQL